MDYVHKHTHTSIGEVSYQAKKTERECVQTKEWKLYIYIYMCVCVCVVCVCVCVCVL